jgi:uncharacterized SAM-binding protein YcdF (DUF218 family)
MEWDLYQFKKVFDSALLCQPNSSLIICSVGLLFSAMRLTRRTGFSLILLAMIWLLLSSFPITGYLLIRSLERQARAEVHKTDLRELRVTYVVVLGDVAESVKVRNEIPNAKLLISAGECGESMAETARKLGVPAKDILLESESRDTSEQAARLKPFLGSEPFVLCTWALHSPRAVLAFKLEGLNPIPVPSGFMQGPAPVMRAFRPSRDAWKQVRMGLHEYAGMLWLLISHIKGDYRAWGTEFSAHFS